MLTFTVLACLVVADDPVAAAQRRYPVAPVRITSASGSFTYYTLPADAPPDLRRAYRMLEIAERETALTDRLERLKAEYVEREGRLDAAIANRQLFELESFRTVNRPYRGIQGPGYGYPGWYYSYSYPYYTRPSALKSNLSGVIAASATTEKAMLAADRLAQAQLDLRKTLLDIAAREHLAAPKQLP